MKKLTKLIAVGSTVCCLSFGAMAVADTATTSPAVTKDVSGGISFVIEVKDGTLTSSGGKNYNLVVPVSEVNSVLAFSGRPNRIAMHLTPEAYSKMVHSGSNSFDKNPPNMAVTFNSGDSVAFEIMGSTKDSTSITYKLVLLGDQTAPKDQSGNVSLFIDTFPPWDVDPSKSG